MPTAASRRSPWLAVFPVVLLGLILITERDDSRPEPSTSGTRDREQSASDPASRPPTKGDLASRVIRVRDDLGHLLRDSALVVDGVRDARRANIARRELGEAIRALAPEDLPALAKLLEKVPDLETRRLAVLRIGECAQDVADNTHEAAGRALTSYARYLAEQRPAGAERLAEAKALFAGIGYLKDDSAFDVIHGVLTEGPKDWRPFAIAALGWHPRRDEELAMLLEFATESPVDVVRAAAARALVGVTDTRTIAALETAFTNEAVAEVRGGLAAALGQGQRDSSVPILETALRDDDTRLRYTIIDALGVIHSTHAARALERHTLIEATPRLRNRARRLADEILHPSGEN